MVNKHRFSFEIKRLDHQTNFIIHSPIHTTVPKVIALVLVLGSSAFLGLTLVDYFQNGQDASEREADLISVIFTAFCVCFCVILSIIFFARFTVIIRKDIAVIGHRFWKLHRSEMITKHEITNIRWITEKSGGEYYVYLNIETPSRTYRFQPLGTVISRPKPSPELQQFLDSFRQALEHELSIESFS